MVKYIALMLSVILSFSGCNLLGTQYETIDYAGISVEAPVKWAVQRFYDDEVNKCHVLVLDPMYNDAVCVFRVYQNKKLSKTIFESIKTDMLTSDLGFEENTKFTGIYKSTFNGAKTHEVAFAGMLEDMKYEGKIILFQDSRDTFVIYLFGEKTFLESKNLKHVLESFKIKNASFVL